MRKGIISTKFKLAATCGEGGRGGTRESMQVDGRHW